MDAAFEARVLSSWDEGGFFSKLRHLDFDAASGRKMHQYLEEQEITSIEEFVRFVRHTFVISHFMASWEARAVIAGADKAEYSNLSAAFFDVIHEKIIGFSLDETGEAAG